MDVVYATEKITSSIKNGDKLIICENGGSAGDAQHIAGEFVNRFLIKRSPLARIALITNTSILTAIGNDYGFDYVFFKTNSSIRK